MKKNKLTILILAGVMLATVTCAISLPDLYTAWAEAEELALLRADINSLGEQLADLQQDFDEHTHDVNVEDLQEQFDDCVAEWDVLIIETLEEIKERVR